MEETYFSKPFITCSEDSLQIVCDIRLFLVPAYFLLCIFHHKLLYCISGAKMGLSCYSKVLTRSNIFYISVVFCLFVSISKNFFWMPAIHLSYSFLSEKVYLLTPWYLLYKTDCLTWLLHHNLSWLSGEE